MSRVHSDARMNTYRVIHEGVVHVVRTKDRYSLGDTLASAQFACGVLGVVLVAGVPRPTWLVVVDGPVTCMTCMCNL